MTPIAARGRRAFRAFACLLVLLPGLALAQFLDAPTQQKVRAATFEVVMLKPEDSNLSFEKPLPLELLPYQFRNDKYFSVGTAFAIGDHRYITAGHVLAPGITSQWGTPALRDGSGKVYPLGKVLKYSVARDFAVFTLAEDPAVQPFETAARPELNDTVYAVGNALGEGVVIRDGLYTSDTPEERDGKWKWLRFSAAASPGNSGGPLLDKAGRVIGVVLRKSPNENLNYALPIDEVLNAPDNTAAIDGRSTYQLEVFNYRQTENVNQRIALPLDYPAFAAKAREVINASEDQILADLLKNNAEHIFPRGEGVTELLRSVQANETPGLITRQQDGRWEVRHPAQTARADLGHNGFVTSGRLTTVVLATMRRSDNVDAARFYSDSTLYMDSLLKGMPLQRGVGEESIRIISLGKASVDTVYVDAYRRKWQLRQWMLPYQDHVVTSLALPVPEGYIAMVRTLPSILSHSNVMDLEAMTSFAAVPFGGTLAQWQDYLKLPELHLAALKSIELKFDYGKQLDYASPRLRFSYTPALQKITPGSELFLNFSYFEDHGSVVWDVVRVRADEDAHAQSFISVARNIEPAESMGDDSKSRWARLVHRQHPYDQVVAHDGDLSTIRTVHAPTSAAAVDEPAVLYSLLLQNDGVLEQPAMQAKLDVLLQGFEAGDDRTPRSSGATASQD